MEALSLASEKSWSLALTDDSAPDDINPLFLTSLECNVLTVPLILPLHTSSFSPPLQYLVVFPLPGHFQRLLSSHCCHTLACESLTGRGKPTGLSKQLVWISPSTTKNIYSSYNEIFYNNGSKGGLYVRGTAFGFLFEITHIAHSHSCFQPLSAGICG